MAKKNSKKLSDRECTDVLKERISVTMNELLRMIHRINPTGEKLNPERTSERYRVKAQLQSLLIRRFKDHLTVVQPDPEQPNLVGLQLSSFFDDDACHATIDELDPDARAWVQERLADSLLTNPDEGFEPGLNQSHPETKAAPRIGDDAYCMNDTLALGRKALTEFDYEACELHGRAALGMAGDDPFPAVLLLELYVDHIADYEKALDLANSLPTRVQSDETVEAYLILALARSGRIDEAVEHARRTVTPKPPEVYFLAAEHYVGQDDIDRASSCLNELESIDPGEFRSNAAQLRQRIQAIRAKRLEPDERKMLDDLKEGRIKEALKLADSILAVLPANKAAQRVLNEIKIRQREEKICRLLSAADDARYCSDFVLEADLLKRAIAEGVDTDADAGALQERLEVAKNKARARESEAGIQRVVDLFTAGNRKEALAQYHGLAEPERCQVRERTQDAHFAWLDLIAFPRPIGKLEVLVEAVLILGKSKKALDLGKDLAQIVKDLQAHSQILDFIPEATELLQRLETLVRESRAKAAKVALEDAVRFLEMGNLCQARAALDLIQPASLPDVERPVFETCNGKLMDLEINAKLKQKYGQARERGNYLAARGLARELAASAAHDSTEEWMNRVNECDSAIKKEWFLVNFDCGDLPLFFATIGASGFGQNESGCLLSDRSTLVFGTSHDRWVFLRFFSLAEQAFKRVVLLRTPHPMSLERISPVGNTLWLVGERGDTLEVGLEPLQIHSWQEAASFVSSEKVIEDVWLFPKSRLLWFQLSSGGAKLDFSNVVMDLDRQRVSKLKGFLGFPMVVNARGRFLIGFQKYGDRELKLFSEQGKFLWSFDLSRGQSVHSISMHPNGKDFLILPFRPKEFWGETTIDSLRSAPNMCLEIRPERGNTYPPVLIEDSDGEADHSVFTSFDSGVVFVRFMESILADSKTILAAFKDVGGRFELLFRIPIPERTLFFCDEFSNVFVATKIRSDKFNAIFLNESSPDLQGDRTDSSKKVFPELRGDFLPCYFLPRNSTFVSKYEDFILNAEPKRADEIFREMKTPGSHSPDEIDSFRWALYWSSSYDRANELKEFLGANYPDHPCVRQDSASQAAHDENWEEVVRLLEGFLPDDEEEEDNICHLYHLLGIAFFRMGNIEKALSAWEEGKLYGEDPCNLCDCIEFAQLALGKTNEGVKDDEARAGAGAGVEDAMQKAFKHCEAIEDALAHERWRDVVETIWKMDAISIGNFQIQARLSYALLKQISIPRTLEWFFKAVSLGNYCQMTDNKITVKPPVFPPRFKIWSESRLNDVAMQAKQWLVSVAGA